MHKDIEYTDLMRRDNEVINKDNKKVSGSGIKYADIHLQAIIIYFSDHETSWQILGRSIE